MLGVIDAQGRHDLNIALEQLAGGLTGPLRAAREQLLDLLAELEAGLDFVEEDIEFITAAELTRKLAEARDGVTQVERQMAERAVAADRPRVVFCGRPNVGKSSLFNALAGADASIVADRPGVTRDYVSARLELPGSRCELIDTAGADESLAPELVEAIAPITLAAAARHCTARERERGDVIVLCLDATRPLDAWEHSQLTAADERMLIVVTKADCLRASGFEPRRREPRGNHRRLGFAIPHRDQRRDRRRARLLERRARAPPGKPSAARGRRGVGHGRAHARQPCRGARIALGGLGAA